MPAVARVPLAPTSLMGVANLRGAVLPVASLRGLLGQDETAITAGSRAIILDGAAPVALAVDRVGSLVEVDAERVETRQVELAAEPGEQLRGAFQAGEGAAGVAKILDIKSLLAGAFAPRVRAQRQARPGGTLAAEAAGLSGDQARQKLVTFEVAGQEFGLGLEAVREIVAAPVDLAAVAGAEALILGVVAYRQGLLPVLSLRGLLGFCPANTVGDREKMLVTTVAGVLVGLVADRMRSIIPVDPERLEPTPSVLAARTGGESRIRAIYREGDGRRLISVLAPEQLFREDVMQRLEQGAEFGHAVEQGARSEADERQFLVFKLGDDEFGLPIEAVDEVAKVPEKVTRLPKTPKFLEGVINLRGEVLPVIDQRRRFDMPKSEQTARRRLVVLRSDRHRAGLLVDSVSEVLRSSIEAIVPAPDLTGEAVRLVYGVINLEGSGRMVMVLDPAELLSRTERGLLDAFAAAGQGKA